MASRILIAEDHEIMRRTLRKVLEFQDGWEVCAEAENGLDAVQKTAELKPDLVILDLAMPVMDGLQAAREISSAAPALPILLYTNYASSLEATLDAKKHGVRQVIDKGKPLDQLLRVVAALLGQHPRPSVQEACADVGPSVAPLETGPENH